MNFNTAASLVVANPQLRLMVPVKHGLFVHLMPNNKPEGKPAFTDQLRQKYQVPQHIPACFLVRVVEIKMQSTGLTEIKELCDKYLDWGGAESDLKRTQYMVY